MFNLYCIHNQIFHKINYFHKQCIDFKVSVSIILLYLGGMVCGSKYKHSRTSCSSPVYHSSSKRRWTSSHHAVITRAGFYFFHLGGGLPAGIRSWLHVHVNNAGRCGIVHLSSGVVVHVFGDGNGFYSDNQMQSIFIGFLLYE